MCVGGAFVFGVCIGGECVCVCIWRVGVGLCVVVGRFPANVL